MPHAHSPSTIYCAFFSEMCAKVVTCLYCASLVGNKYQGFSMETHYSQLSRHLYVHHGHVNTGILRDANRALLIDPSGASLQTTLAELGISNVEQILYTHHHRDNTAGFPIPENACVGVPAAEAQWFSDVETFWNDPKYRWHLYNCHPHNLMLANSIDVTDTYTEGAQIAWGPASIEVLDTPGHTDGSVTYLD